MPSILRKACVALFADCTPARSQLVRRLCLSVLLSAVALAAPAAEPGESVGGDGRASTVLPIEAWAGEAEAAYRAGDYAAAAAAGERLLAALRARNPTNALDLAAVLDFLGRSYHQGGGLQEAEPSLAEALAIRRSSLPAGHPAMAESLANLAQLYRDQGRLAEAQPLFEEALSVYRAILPAGHPRIAAALDDLAQLYHDQGRLDAAAPLYEEALSLYRAGLPPGHPNLARGLNNLALLYRDQGRFTEAEPLYEEALSILQAALPGDHRLIATAAHNLAQLRRAQGRLAEAEPLYERALAIRRIALPKDHPLLATSLDGLAELYRAQGRLAEAEDLYQEALSIRRRVLRPDHPNVATSLNSLAELYLAQVRLTEAEPLFEEALSIYRRALPQGHPDIATGLNNLAGLYRAQGRLAEAKAHYGEALAISRAALPGGHPEIATNLNNLGLVLEAEGELVEAERFYRQALAILRVALRADHPSIAMSLSNLALLYQRQGRLAEARRLQEQSLAILLTSLPREHPLTARGLGEMAWLDFLDRRPHAAAEGLWEAVEILTAPGNRGRLDLWTRTLGRHALAALEAWSLEPDPSVPAATPAAAFISLQWPLLGTAGEALLAARARSALGGDELDQIVRRRDGILAEQEAAQQDYVAALGKPADHGGAAGLAALQAHYEQVKTDLAASEQRIAENFADYAELALPQPLGLEETQALLGPDEALFTFLLADPTIAMVVTSDGYDWAFLPKGSDLVDKARQLRCQAAVSDPACRAGPPIAGLRSAEATRQPLDLADPDEDFERQAFDLALAHDLYRDLLGPFEQTLAGKTHLIVAPDGGLMGFPFQLLVSEAPRPGLDEAAGYRQAAWLIRDRAVSVLPMVSSLRALRALGEDRPAAGRSFVGFADPAIGSGEAMVCPPSGTQLAALGEVAADVLRSAAGVSAAALMRSGERGEGIALADVAAVRALARLPDTRCELEAVGDVLGAGEQDRYLDREATESRVKALSEQGRLADYRVLLFATHGLVAGEAGAAEPALVLTPPEKATAEDDGLLTASEVAALKLNADWVILSACNTASGGDPNAGALTGLAKAFFYAGTESLLVSHWPVYSGSTVTLVTGTIDRLAAGPGLSRAEALRQAMLAFLDPERPDLDPHPAHWAPFSLVGEGGAR